jgi:hypothetical protein
MKPIQPTKFTRTYEDEFATEVWTYDLEKFQNGPIDVDIKYKTGAEKKMKELSKQAKADKRTALQMKKINNRNK